MGLTPLHHLASPGDTAWASMQANPFHPSSTTFNAYANLRLSSLMSARQQALFLFGAESDVVNAYGDTDACFVELWIV